MRKLSYYTVRMITEALEIDLEKDDVILTGKFKNKRRIVKSMGTDDLGQPTVNDKPALKFRIEKEMPKEKWSKKSKEELENKDKDESQMIVSEQTIRDFIRNTILESRFKQMSKPKFTDLKAALRGSSFLKADPEGDGLDDEDWSSEASDALRQTLNDYFDSKFGPGKIVSLVKASMIPEGPHSGVDSALKGANYYYDADGHNIEVTIASLEDGSLLGDLGDVAQKAYEVITHELLHMQQFLKFSRGKPNAEKWDAFMKEYSSLGGASGMKGDYFFFDNQQGPSELETFSFQMANELNSSMGKEAAVAALNQSRLDFSVIKSNSASFRDIERRADITRPEFREMLHRAKQYIKRM